MSVFPAPTATRRQATGKLSLRGLTLEHLLYASALGLALWVRLLNLGAAPLSDAEAGWAMQALHLAQRASASGGASGYAAPGYWALTGSLIALFGSTTFLARLLPALAGALLALAPVFFRDTLGRRAALILAFGLAIDPGLAAVSRRADGPVMALSFGLLAFGLWRARRPITAGLLAGLALLSGPAFLQGALGLALAGVVAVMIGGYEAVRPWLPPSLDGRPPAMQRVALFSAGAAVLLASTLFFSAPQGLGAWLDMIPAYFRGWAASSSVHPLLPLAALVFYQPLALIFGAIGAVQGLTSEGRSSQALLPLLWAASALLLALLYPARQAADAAWALLPLWALAALALDRLWPEEGFSIVTLAHGALVFLLLGLFWFTLAALNRALPGASEPAVRLAVLAGVALLIGLVTLLVALGWSWETGRNGLLVGLMAGLAVYLISALWGASQVRPGQPQELWTQPPAPGQAGLLVNTLETLSARTTGFPDDIDIVSTVDAPSLRWALRNIKGARFVDVLDAAEQPSAAITAQDQQTPALAAAYAGQDFTWWVRPAWPGALPQDLAAWFTYRDAPVQEDQVILWVRGDLFPGNEAAQP